MTKGGARVVSGPPPDLTSGRSERRGIKPGDLPAGGYQGDAPDLEPFIPSASERERAVWAMQWRTPQAQAWARESWRWQSVADLVRFSVRLEARDAPATLATAVRSLRDDLGLTTAGMARNGWRVAPDELGEKRAEVGAPVRPASSRERMKVVGGN